MSRASLLKKRPRGAAASLQSARSPRGPATGPNGRLDRRTTVLWQGLPAALIGRCVVVTNGTPGCLVASPEHALWFARWSRRAHTALPLAGCAVADSARAHRAHDAQEVLRSPRTGAKRSRGRALSPHVATHEPAPGAGQGVRCYLTGPFFCRIMDGWAQWPTHHVEIAPLPIGRSVAFSAEGAGVGFCVRSDGWTNKSTRPAERTYQA